MRIKSRWFVVPLVVGASFAACITVNIYFPAPEVRAAAEKIVDETWGGATAAPSGSEQPAEEVSPGTQGRLHRWPFGAAVALAAGPAPNINVETAAIRKLKAAMRERAAQLKPYLAAGNLGIGKDGMLVVRDLSGLDLRQKATIRRLVDAENRDRRSLYAEIARANDFGSDRIDDIAKIFAETWIRKAEGGWWVQSPDGSWHKR
ncbi:MAG: DUF1318 domain-containing protein [Deltaproteobacteria bacterium]|nr:MAG: DUF1318 domain-containing protein [Deltaproteobacteria bacterium]